MADIFSLAGKKVVITGGSGYLGSAIVEGLQGAGAQVAVADIMPREGAAEETLFIACDVCETASIQEMLKAAEAKMGRIDVLINCATVGAGYGQGAAIENMTDEIWQKGLDGAIGVIFRATREVIPYMEKIGGGSIVNFSSMYGLVSPDPSVYGDSGSNNPPNYGAGKAAVLQLTRHCAAHLASKGIRVNAISPGPFPNRHKPQSEELMENLTRKTMLKRLGTPQEIVGPVVLLASDASSFMTGTNITVDGGWTAW